MSDLITKCDGKTCVKKETCHRFTVPAASGWQFWDNYYTHTAKECPWSIPTKNDIQKTEND
jgi:hypothetical protein